MEQVTIVSKRKPTTNSTNNTLAIFVVLMIAATQVLAPIPHYFGYFPKFWLAAVSLISLSLFCYFNSSKDINLTWHPLLSTWLIGCLWMFISLLWVTNSYYALHEINIFWSAIIIATVIYICLSSTTLNRWNSTTETLLLRLLSLLFLAGFLQSILGICQYLFAVDWVPQIISPAATFGNKNMAAHYVVISLPLGLGLWLLANSTISVFYYSTAVSIVSIYILYTQTRAAWLAGAFAIALLIGYLIINKKYLFTTKKASPKHLWPFKTKAIVLLVMISILTGTTLFISDDSKHLLFSGQHSRDNKTTDPSNNRLTIWSNSIPMLLDYGLIGTGIGNWPIQYPAYQQSTTIDTTMRDTMVEWRRAHNDYLQLIIELGVVGLTILIISAYYFVKLGLQVIRQGNHFLTPTSLILTVSAYIALTIGLITACFSFPWRIPATLTTHCALLAILLWVNNFINAQKTWRINKQQMRWVGVLSIFILALVLGAHYKGYRAWEYHSLATGAHQRNDNPTAAKLSIQAFSHNPLDTDMLAIASQAYLRTEQYQSAKPLLEKMYSQFPNRKQVLIDLGFLYLQLKEYQKALPFYIHYASIAPKSFIAHSNLGTLYYYMKQYKNMKQHYQIALELRPNTKQTQHFQKLIDYYAQ